MAQSDVILPTERPHELPAVRTLTLADLRDALAKGLDDFWAMPTHVIFLSLIYPIVGIALARATCRSSFHLPRASLSSVHSPRLASTS
jgi:uncharacterized membrane protein